MEVTNREYLLLLAIDMEAEDMRDYVPLVNIVNHFNSLQELKSALNSCSAKKLIVVSDYKAIVLGQGSEIALTDLGVEHVRKRKKELNHVPHIPYT